MLWQMRLAHLPQHLLRVCLISITTACERCRRSPDGVCGVETCAKRMFPHHTLHHLRGFAARAPGFERHVGATLADAVWGTPSPRWRLCGPAQSTGPNQARADNAPEL